MNRTLQWGSREKLSQRQIGEHESVLWLDHKMIHCYRLSCFFKSGGETGGSSWPLAASSCVSDLRRLYAMFWSLFLLVTWDVTLGSALATVAKKSVVVFCSSFVVVFVHRLLFVVPVHVKNNIFFILKQKHSCPPTKAGCEVLHDNWCFHWTNLFTVHYFNQLVRCEEWFTSYM